MSEFKPPAEIEVRFEGGHFVPDQPIDLPEGVPFKIVILDHQNAIKAGASQRFRHFVGSGKNLTRPDDRFIDDRETYYEDRV